MPKRCDGCGMWVSTDQTKARGRCHLKPPVIMLMPVMFDAKGAVVQGRESRLAQSAVQEQLLPTCHWPLTTAAEFCGEWRLPQ